MKSGNMFKLLVQKFCASELNSHARDESSSSTRWYVVLELICHTTTWCANLGYCEIARICVVSNQGAVDHKQTTTSRRQQDTNAMAEPETRMKMVLTGLTEFVS